MVAADHDWPRLARLSLQVERLEAENEALRRQIEPERARALKAEEEASSNEGWAFSEQEGRHEAERERDEALALVAAKDAALEPFAIFADEIEIEGRVLADDDGIYAFTAGMFRRARAARNMESGDG